MSGLNLKPTQEFLAAGSTDMAVKSQFVGHALCVHAALFEQKIPWLIDVENKKLVSKYNPKFGQTKKRPDFIGYDHQKRWYVFESKGRVTKPTPSNLKEWKKQAKAITQIKGKAVSQHIVSVAFLRRREEWELLWVDPPVHEGGIQFEFDDASYFDAYYDPIRDLIEREPLTITIGDNLLYYIPLLDAYVGLHKTILNALENRESDSIRAFASNRAHFGLEMIDGATISIFADGIMIALPKDLDKEKTRPSKNPHGKEPGSRFTELEL